LAELLYLDGKDSAGVKTGSVQFGQQLSKDSVPVVLASDQSVTIGVDIDKDNDSIAVWTNTAKDGSGTDYQPIVDSDGHFQVDVLSAPSITVTATDLDIRDLDYLQDNVEIKNADGSIAVQNPLDTDGDSVYSKDIDTGNSSIGDFSGAITDLFDSLTSTVTTSTNNPSFSITLLRPTDSHAVTIITPSGDFSNVTIVAKDASGATLETVDDSANGTKYTLNEYFFSTIDRWSTLDVSFTTNDDVTLGFLQIAKSIHTDAHLHALKPDGTVTAIDATAGGNLKVSLEEIESGISSNSNSQLNTTLFKSDGTELNLDAAGDVQVDIKSADMSDIDSNNSTTDQLDPAETYTGTGTDVEGYNSVAIVIFSDEDSAASGMQFQFSQDDTNWDEINSFALDASSSQSRRFQFAVNAKYFRVVYTNGGTITTEFRIQTLLHRSNILTSIHRTDDILKVDRSATLVKAVVAGKVQSGNSHTTADDGQYDNLAMTHWRELLTRDQRAVDLQNCNDYTDFTVLGNDTDNLADELNHVFGTGAITFDKVNGAADTVYAGVSFVIPSLDLSEIFEDGGFVATGAFLPSLTNVIAVGIRLGTDSTNYNYWEWGVADMTANTWMQLRQPTSQPDGYLGNGWNTADVDYGAVYVRYSNQNNTASGLIFDNIHMVGGRVTDTTLDASISSSVTTPNINLHRVAGTATDSNAGAVGNGTQRVILASDDPAVTSLATIASPFGTPINEYAEQGAIAFETETTVVTYAVPGGTTLNIQGFSASGTATARFRLFIDAAAVGILRTSAAERSISVDYANGVIQAAAATTVTIKAYHEETANQTFQGNLFGYLT